MSVNGKNIYKLAVYNSQLMYSITINYSYSNKSDVLNRKMLEYKKALSKLLAARDVS
jgi:hypothetical protein